MPFVLLFYHREDSKGYNEDSSHILASTMKRTAARTPGDKVRSGAFRRVSCRMDIRASFRASGALGNLVARQDNVPNLVADLGDRSAALGSEREGLLAQLHRDLGDRTWPVGHPV